MEGFLLGLGNGTACVAACYPMILPYLLSENKGLSGNAGTLLRFLAGRLVGYIAVGLAAGALGNLLKLDGGAAAIVHAVSTLLIALLLLLWPLLRSLQARKRCAVHWAASLPVRGAWFMPLLGLLTGLSICPPFIAGITRAVAAGSMLGGALFFLMFYLGTTVYFLPLPLIGLLRRRDNLRFIANAAMALMGAYYLMRGILEIIALRQGG